MTGILEHFGFYLNLAFQEASSDPALIGDLVPSRAGESQGSSLGPPEGGADSGLLIATGWEWKLEPLLGFSVIQQEG